MPPLPERKQVQETRVNTSPEELRSWIGRSETVRDTVNPTPVVALTATLDHPHAEIASGTAIPPLWHWLYFLPMHRQSEIGADGHAKRGGFLPPVPLPRRMWAGSQFEFRSPIRVGDRVERTSTIDDVTTKEGRTGKLVFVKVRHEIRCNEASDPALLEFHDIVYREAQTPNDVVPPPQAAPAQAAWRRQIVPDDVLLFRYSALTFNGHRIHYDRQYVTQVEGYPGLVVHGPLIATLLLDLLRRSMPGADVASFRFKAVRPTFDLHPFHVSGEPQPDGKTVRLWASDHEGWLTMDATVVLR
jgi:3-methylfumaryl-CoA hydratase